MNTGSLTYLDDLYFDFMNDPDSVPEEWRRYFEAYAEALDSNGVLPPLPPGEASAETNGSGPGGPVADVNRLQRVLDLAHAQDRVDQLVRGYRVRGHLVARFNPLNLIRPDEPEIKKETYGFVDDDLKRRFSTRTIGGGNLRTLGDIVGLLEDTYCRAIGVQFMHIDSLEVRRWLQDRMENSRNRLKMPHEQKLRILTRLTDAVIFEEFVRKKYTGAKTFSLEGAESLIPLLDLALEKAGDHGVSSVVFGMAHRGRLNVLANILKKPLQNIFWSFDDPRPELNLGRGDVRYHLGYSSDWVTSTGKKLHLSLCFNPSHLEYVNTVAIGRTRAKQDRMGDHARGKGLTILIHGDAAFAGEGIVQETLNLSQLPGYGTGGTLHVIVNNQIGFTTPPDRGRSSTYATDVAKMLQIPIFHVNGEDPDAVAQAITLGMDFRNEFHRDFVIDMYCYRRWGHNEGDEPRFTQPRLYREFIDKRPSVRDSYLEHLLEQEAADEDPVKVTQEQADRIRDERFDHLDRMFNRAQTEEFEPDINTLQGFWEGYYGGPERVEDDPDTGVDRERLGQIIEGLRTLPDGFELHRKIKPIFERRGQMGRGERDLDWATAELAAFGSLAVEGHCVRLSGQDSGRGTFSQRHAVVYDWDTGESHMSLAHLHPKQAPVEVVDSPLSEAGVLGFEYGYSLDSPDALVCWEAQFGDFWNAAQVIVDQFIASAEDKWYRLSGLVMLLPHGFEGQGPEHSSARIERFLALSAEHNIQVVCPTTPAQHFHLLRRQVVRKWRKPLVVLTPKSLLRHLQCVSPLEDLTQGSFQRVIPDKTAVNPQRLILCYGKVYYDLLEALQADDRQDVALVRVEQLYPFPRDLLAEILAEHPSGSPVYWVQEEPANMGAWPFIRMTFGDAMFNHPLIGVTRPESASPSTGSSGTHKLEQRDLINRALSGSS